MHSIGLLLEQPIKKRKFDGDKDDENCRNQQRSVTVRLFSEAGKELSEAPVVVLASTTAEQLQSLYHQLLRNQKQPKDTNAGEEEDDDELAAPVQFRTAADEPNGRNWTEIVDSLLDSLPPEQLFVEKPLELVCLPQAVFRVRPVTRCAASLPGHGEPVLSVQFSPDGSCLASGSGDRTVRLWDLHTNLPKQTLSGHSDWVLCIGWSPDGRALASACKSGVVRVWDARSGAQRRVLNGHQKWVNAIAWQPLHVASDAECRLLASAGWDKTIRIWDIQLGATVRVLSGHNASVTAIRWGGCGLIYSGSQDRTVKVWRADDGTLCRTLTGHGHWINTLSLSCDYVLRLGFFSAEAQSKGQPVLSPSDESSPQKVFESSRRPIGGTARVGVGRLHHVFVGAGREEAANCAAYRPSTVGQPGPIFAGHAHHRLRFFRQIDQTLGRTHWQIHRHSTRPCGPGLPNCLVLRRPPSRLGLSRFDAEGLEHPDHQIDVGFAWPWRRSVRGGLESKRRKCGQWGQRQIAKVVEEIINIHCFC
ncbi:hypothetical protein GPALN_013044 [Globodera pallida]|nr:hypothetical protein GPALN_013044 [Globodera pallida]